MDKRILRVKEINRAEAKPDLVVISFKIESPGLDYGNTINKLNGKVNTLHSDLKKLALIKRVKTTNFRVNTEYKRRKHKSFFIGYVQDTRLI